jgi:hypothetical protein
MPLNHLELQPEIRAYALNASKARQKMNENRITALEWLRICAASPYEDLRNQCKRSGERCALPCEEQLDQSYKAAAIAGPYVLLAADGSQIIPSAHDAVPVSLINTSRICLEPDSRQAPQVVVHSEILKDIQEGIEVAVLSEDLINLKRDVSELEILNDWQNSGSQAIIALRDGPLELFHEPRQGAPFEQAFEDYVKLLGELARRNFILAGYIDRSRATLVSRMLEIFAEGHLSADGTSPSLAGLPDGMLMEALLQPGQRSAIFELQSSSSTHYPDNLRVHFFYLNVGSTSRPYIVRVELPAWAARETKSVSLLQRILLDQCSLLAGRPYPYVLHRAHEEAVVHFEEKEQLQNNLALEMQRRGLEPSLPSHKLSAKELQNRTRM